MINPIETKEFIGRFSISYKDGEMVYAYDDITHGLYRVSLRLGEVNIALSPEKIHCSPPDRIIGITKKGSEIILIPSWLNLKWIFYDVEKEEIHYDFPIKNRIQISCVTTIGTNLFLIPNDIVNPIILFSLDTMKIIKSYETWYNQDSDRADKNIWGVSSYHDTVLFPVMNSRQIVYMNIDHIRVITCDIPYPIFSASMYKDKIWILPVSGEKIYMANLKGKILDRINLSQGEFKISVDKFIRIVATEQDVFLLPIYGEKIYIYQYRKKQIVPIETEKTYFWRNMFFEVNGMVPYWDYIVDNEVLYLLPCDYRCKKIHMLSLEKEEYSLYYGPTIHYEEYCSLIRYVQKGHIAEEIRNNLKDFLQYVLVLDEKYLIEKNKNIGKKIWENTT